MGERYSKYMGGGVHPTSEIKLNQPISVTFVHDFPQDVSSVPTCAYWNVESHRWSSVGCKLLQTNQTHSRCGCQRLASFALLAPPGFNDYYFNGGQPGSYSSQHDILVGIMAAIILVLILVVFGVLFCYCRRRKVSFIKFY